MRRAVGVAAHGRIQREHQAKRVGHVRPGLPTALDIESIRRSLRLPAPRLIGFSYGTLLATAYLRRFGHVVRAAVLDGAFPAAGDLFSADVAIGTTRVTRLVCGRTGACDSDAAVASVGRLAAQVRARPLSLPGRRQELTESVLATVLPALLQDGGPAVLAAVSAAADGAPEQFQRLAAAAIGPIPAGSRALSSALGIAVQCNDCSYAYNVRGPVRPRRAALRDALGALADDAFAPFSKAAWAAVGNDHPSPCLSWPPTRAPAALRLPSGPLRAFRCSSSPATSTCRRRSRAPVARRRPSRVTSW